MSKIEAGRTNYQNYFMYKQKFSYTEQLIKLNQQIKVLEDVRCADSSFSGKRKELYLQRGKILMELKEYQKALVNFEKAEECDKNDRLVFLNKAKAYYKLGNFCFI